jgi:hypothetical protein
MSHTFRASKNCYIKIDKFFSIILQQSMIFFKKFKYFYGQHILSLSHLKNFKYLKT